ncbi:unnamed protein product [Heterobilharzia americana]|nr:unnamed protein product [Heterobilharzia americana]CAH8472354.1 unnamed protein product [Heterobilharzia americana]
MLVCFLLTYLHVECFTDLSPLSIVPTKAVDVRGVRPCAMTQELTSVCVIFSGKRKSVVRISEPIKSYFAQQYGLDFSELLSSNSYKENYRKQMIDWMEQQIQKDPYIFPRKAFYECLKRCEKSEPDIIIVSDARRMNDVEFFIKKFSRSKCLLVRITSPIEIRVQRGWSFVDGIDNVMSECGLDEFTDWDLIISNDGDEVTYQNYMKDIVSHTKQMLHISL